MVVRSRQETKTREDSEDSAAPLLSHAFAGNGPGTLAPRIFHGADFASIEDDRDVDYLAVSLPSRPRSPLRRLLPGRFNYRASIVSFREYQASSRRVSTIPVDEDTHASGLVLRTILERVDSSIDTSRRDLVVDVDVLVGIAAGWALVDLDEHGEDVTTSRRKRPILARLTVKPPAIKQRATTASIRAPTLRGVLETTLDVDRRSDADRPHRRPGWHLVGPIHGRGGARGRRDVREVIDETTVRRRADHPSDFSCRHARELTPDRLDGIVDGDDKISPRSRRRENGRVEDLFIHVVSFN